MDIEQLKLVLDTVAKIGTDSKEAFFWWVFAKEVFPYLISLFWIGLIGYVVRAVIKANSEIEQLRNHFGFSKYTSITEILQSLARN